MRDIVQVGGGDLVRHVAEAPIVVVGGTGVVGTHLVGLLRQCGTPAPVAVAGRSEPRARQLQAAYPGVGFVPVDLRGPAPFVLDARAVVAAVNDPEDRLLAACLGGGVPYVDIARWTSRLQQAVALSAVLGPRAPVVFSSGWMGGVVARVAAALALQVGGADAVQTAVRYDLADRAGEDAVEFMDRLWIPFEVTEGGRRRTVDPLDDARVVRVGPGRVRVVRLDTPEQATLPLTLGARTVATRIGFSAPAATWGLVVLKRLGVFHALRAECCAPARRALLRSNGTGGTAALRVDVRGPGGATCATVADPAGQAHLTAIGALLSLRWALGLDGSPPAGVAFPEQAAGVGDTLAQLAALGAAVAQPASERREVA